MRKIVALGHHDLKISVGPTELRLYNATWSTGIGRDYLPSFPRQADIRIIMPPMREISPLWNNHLKVSVLPAVKI